MLEKLTQKPFTERLKDTGFLLKNSFAIIGKDSDIIKPTIHMAIFSTALTTLFFASLLTFFTGSYIGYGIATLLVLIFILTPFKFFYYIRQKADQSWIVYNTVTGKDISYKDAHEHTKTQKSSLRKIALIELLVQYAGSQRSNKRGIGAILINIFLSALVEIWDLISHYMIPAVVIEQKPMKEIIPQIKSLRNNVPATLVGVFGIDFAGNVIGTILLPLYLIILAAGIGIAVFVTPGSIFLPILIAIYINLIIGGIVRKITESIKVIYFTIFYTAITRPMDITKDMREELTHYLLMEAIPKATAIPKGEPDLQQLADNISQYLKTGYTEKKIRDFLTSKGYPAKNINKAFALIKK